MGKERFKNEGRKVGGQEEPVMPDTVERSQIRMEKYPLAFVLAAPKLAASVNSLLREGGLHFLGLRTDYHKLTWLKTAIYCLVVLEARILNFSRVALSLALALQRVDVRVLDSS